MPTVPLDQRDPARYYAIQDRVAEGVTITQIIKEFKVDYYTVKKYFPAAGRPDLQGGVALGEEKRLEIGRLVAMNVSLNEISRTLNTDHRTIKKYFPNAGLRPGGGGEAQKIRQVNQDLQRLDKHGNISTRRQHT